MRLSDVFLFLKYHLFSSGFKYPVVLNTMETIDLIIKDKVSVARFGDGEFDMMMNINHPKFQNSNPLLVKKLFETMNTDNEKILICIPKVFEDGDLKTLTKKSAKHWRRFFWRNGEKITKLVDENKVYGNSLFTRNYIDLQEKGNTYIYFEKIKEMWKGKKVIIVEGRYTRFGVGNDLLAGCKSVSRILCPENNAFEKYNEILNQCCQYDRTTMFLIALGPTATILANDLCNLNYQAIDIGHLDIEYEWFLKHAKDKCAIPNKYVNETDDIITENNDTFYNEEYQNSIKKTIF